MTKTNRDMTHPNGKVKGLRRSLSHVDSDWYWAVTDGTGILLIDLTWWERIIYWKWSDKSYKLSR